MLKKICKYFFSFFNTEKKFKYKVVTEIPDKFKEKTIYLISNDGHVWQLIMLCPCGCDVKLFINLIEEQKPFWIYIIDEDKNISLHPSIHRMIKCRCHFFIRKGKVVWV